MDKFPSDNAVDRSAAHQAHSSDKAVSQTMVELSVRPSALKRKSRSEHSGEQSRQWQPSNHSVAVRFKRKDADEVIPSDSVYASGIDQPVRIFKSSEPSEVAATSDLTPITIMTALKRRALLSPEKIALASKLNNSWRKITYPEYHREVTTIAKAFIKLGLERGHGVGILGYNSPEYFIANLAAIFAGGVSVALNVQYSADACQNAAYDSKCSIILVSTETQCLRIFEVKARLPHLKAVVQLPMENSDPFDSDIHTWEELFQIGQESDDDVLQERILQQAPNLCCTLIYKSAPGGQHRGVMLSHDNLLWTATIVGQRLGLTYDRERIVSFLPLSSSYTQVFDIYISILFGSTVHFLSTPDANIKSLLETFKDVRPTVLMAIPRIYDRMFMELSLDFKNEWCLRQKLTNWAIDIGKKMHRAHSRGHDTKPLCFFVADAVVYRHARRRLGLDQTKLCLVTGAPISSKTFYFFVYLDIPILEVYGQAQTSGFQTVSLPLKYRFKSVGQELPGCYIDIVHKDQSGHGEVWVKGRNVFMGYLRDPFDTRLAFSSGEWYNTGDRGITDSDAFLFITGRVQHLLIIQSGDRVVPEPIEEAVRSKLPCVSHCIVVGEGRRFVSLLLTLKTELEDFTLEPSDRLSLPTLEWLRLHGCVEFTTVRDVRVDMNHKVISAIQQVIDSVNSKAMTKADHIEKWAILPKDFSIVGGELDQSNEMNRKAVVDKYSQFIDTLYQHDESID